MASVDFAESPRHNRIMLLETAQATIERHRMLEPGETVLVAVSGGVDSIVLLDVLRRLAPRHELSLVIAHLDHGLRESTSEADARFVEQLGRESNIRVVSERIDVRRAAPRKAPGLEAAAREVRRSFLRDTAGRVNASKIALGHSASDRAETILFRLARGTGGAGLRGIEPVSGAFVRPLIEVPRTEILAYARQERLTWREDPSNTDVAFARNRIRHCVLPELERINPRIVEAICRASDLMAELDVAGSFLSSRLLNNIVSRQEEGRVVLGRASLAALPPAVQRLVLREAFRRVRGDLDGIERQHVEAARHVLTSCEGHGEVNLPRVNVRVQTDEISMSSRSYESPPQWSSPVDLGRTALPERGAFLHLEIAPREDETKIDSSNRMAELADADQVSFPLHVRTRRPGDRFMPLGMGHSVKLKDFLINERVPFFGRDRIPLLCDREKILWVVGVRLSNEVRITEATRRLLVMRAETAP